MKLRFLPLGVLLVALIALAWLSLGQPDFGLAAAPLTPPAADDCALTLPDPAAIIIPPGAQLSDAAALAQAFLARSQPDGAAVTAEANDACAAKRLAALEDLIRPRIALTLLPRAAVAADAVPIIHYFLPLEGLTLWGPFSWVEGMAAPNTTVLLRILRGGSEIAHDSITSNSDGSYFFELTPVCCGATSPWVLTAGDVIEVSAGGQTALTVATPFTAWLNPFTDQLEGSTLPGTQMTVTAYASQFMPDSCEPLSLERSAPVQADGSVVVSWEGVADIKNNASFAACAADASGNGPCFYAMAYHLAVWFPRPDSGAVSCQTKPGSAFTLEVWRDGSRLSSLSGTATNTGGCDYHFSDLKPGDVVRLTRVPTPLEYTIQPLTAALDYELNRLVGATTPGAAVMARFTERGYNYSDGADVTLSSCGGANTCGSGQADASGSFRLGAGYDVARGDYAFLTLYDKDGNSQQPGMINAPALFTDPVMGWVSGYWRAATSSAVMVRVLDSANKVKASGSAFVTPYDAGFFRYLGEGLIKAGDRVEVREMDGQGVESMRVQAWDARLDGATRRLTGSSANGYVLGAWNPECSVVTYLGDPPDVCKQSAAPGKFDLSFGASEPLPSLLTLRGADGHYTKHWVSPFTVSFRMDTFDFDVFPETPNAVVTSALRRNGVTTPIDCRAVRANFFSCVASGSASVLNPPRPGDIVDVKTTDGDATSLSVPVLTVAGSNTPPGIYGTAPAGVEVCTSLEDFARYVPSYQSSYSTSATVPVSVETTASSTGRYFASYVDVMTTATASASVSWPAKPDSSCASLTASFNTADGNSFTAYRFRAQQPQADAFEDDDTQAEASVYNGWQHHTFDAENDADWVRFDVPESAIAEGLTYFIETFNLAYGANHDLALYDMTSTEPLFEWFVDSRDGQPSSRAWQPTKAGAHYLRVRRPWNLGELFCGDVYDLRIRAGDWQRLFLPVTTP